MEFWPISSLKPYENNARIHSDAQISQIAASMVEFGVNAPLLITADGSVVAGHGRLLAAQKIGLKNLPVVILDHLTPIQRRAYILADNKLAEGATWNNELLANELRALEDECMDLSILGFSNEELDSLLATLPENFEEYSAHIPEGNVQAEKIPSVPVHPVSRMGDIWNLGSHKIICGDATKISVVKTLMGKDTAALCFTSPPYGQQRNYTLEIEDWDALMQGVFLCVPIQPDGQILVNLGLIHRDNEVRLYWNKWMEWMGAQGWRRFGWYVWDQGSGLPGDWAGRLAPSFEFVFHFNRAVRHPHKIIPCKYAGKDEHLRSDGTSSSMRGKDGQVQAWTHAGQPVQDYRIPDSVIRISRQKGAIGKGIDHPAVFPVGLPEHIMRAYSNRNDIVYEPFCGSGSSILAGQRSGRQVRAVEIAPEYVDVTVRRFQQQYPEIQVVLENTGEAFGEAAHARGINYE